MTAEGAASGPSITGRDTAGRVRWRQRLPAGLTAKDGGGGKVRLHSVGERVVAVVLARRPDEGPPARGDLVTQDAELDDTPVVPGRDVLAFGFDSAAVRLRDGRARTLGGPWLAVSRHGAAGGRVVVWDASLGLLLALRPERLPVP